MTVNAKLLNYAIISCYFTRKLQLFLWQLIKFVCSIKAQVLFADAYFRMHCFCLCSFVGIKIKRHINATNGISANRWDEMVQDLRKDAMPRDKDVLRWDEDETQQSPTLTTASECTVRQCRSVLKIASKCSICQCRTILTMAYIYISYSPVPFVLTTLTVLRLWVISGCADLRMWQQVKGE